ncbi:unnamed protein product [Meloidogyne enterolobii]|uniref:Uncharacterized protein n=1 Tax=Meloidogyne enterolobii TaxID=390850 RepID=A0ACB0XLK5_MELEN
MCSFSKLRRAVFRRRVCSHRDRHQTTDPEQPLRPNVFRLTGCAGQTRAGNSNDLQVSLGEKGISSICFSTEQSSTQPRFK